MIDPVDADAPNPSPGDDSPGDDSPVNAEPLHFHRLRRFVRPAEQKSIAPVLGLTVLAMALSPFLADHDWSRGLEVAIIGVSAIVALERTGASRVIRRAGIAIVVLATAVAATIPVLHAGRTGSLEEVAAGLFALLLLVTPVLVVIRLMLRPRITIDTLAGALTAYLQIGIFFGALYLLIAVAGLNALAMMAGFSVLVVAITVLLWRRMRGLSTPPGETQN